MAIRYVWSGSLQDDSDGTWNSSTLSYLTLQAAITAATAGTDIIYVATAHSETSASSIALTGPTVIPAIEIISVNKADDTYLKASAAQLTSNGTATDVSFNGAFSTIGIYFDATRFITITPDQNERMMTEDCTFAIGNADNIKITGNSSWLSKNDTFDCTKDSAAATSGIVGSTVDSSITLVNPTFTNVTNRTRCIYASASGEIIVYGGDLSAFTYLVDNIKGYYSDYIKFIGCILHASVSLSDAANNGLAGRIETYLCDDTTGNSISRTELERSVVGTLVVDTTTVRTGGATGPAGALISWAMANTATTTKYYPNISQDIAIWNAATGSTTFTINIAHSLSALLKDDEIWMELDYMDASGDTQTVRITDSAMEADWLAAGANQATNTETWGGTPTYKQELSVTVTPGRVGPIIARVVYALTSGGSVYIDPVLVIS